MFLLFDQNKYKTNAVVWKPSSTVFTVGLMKEEELYRQTETNQVTD